MLKKTKPVPIHSSGSANRNQQRMLSGRAVGAVPVRLVTNSGSPDKIENNLHLSQRVTNHWTQTSYNSIHSEDNNAVGSIESWRILLKQLSMLVGTEGSAAIFFYSIGQLGTQYPALCALSPKHSWPEQLAVVQHTLQQLPQSSAAFARQSLWFRGCQIITRLLGLSLSRRLLHQVAAVQSTYQHG